MFSLQLDDFDGIVFVMYCLEHFDAIIIRYVFILSKGATVLSFMNTNTFIENSKRHGFYLPYTDRTLVTTFDKHFAFSCESPHSTFYTFGCVFL